MRRRAVNFVRSSTLQLTLRRMRTVFTAPKMLGGLAIAAVLLGVSGPFQTFEAFPLPARLAYWLAICAFTFASGFFAGTFVELALEQRLSEWPRFVASSLATAVAVVATVFLVNLLSAQSALLGPEAMLLLGGYVVIISFTVSAAFRLFKPHPPATGTTAKARLLERLPLEKRAPLISLSVQDHYTEVTTAKGSHLVLIRLSDAIAEAGEGLQIHRSHWVSLKAIAKLERQSGKVLLTTANGATLPVSRSYLPAVKAAGLLP